MFSTFLPFALLFGAFCLRALRGFGLGSGCLIVSARSPSRFERLPTAFLIHSRSLYPPGRDAGGIEPHSVLW